ncbi:hypothetical protein ES708_32959 [subsurface metagenome]
MGKEVALDNSKQVPLRTPVRLLPTGFASLGPNRSQFQSISSFLLADSRRGAYIEGHQHVTSQDVLNVYDILGGQLKTGAIDMGFERHSPFLYFAKRSEGENLISPRIRENIVRPGHKRMQPAAAFQHLEPRSQEQMIGVS